MRVPAEPARAFAAFTEEISSWGWDTIPQRHAARHGFPEPVTLQRVADWWRTSLAALRVKIDV